MQRGVVCYAFLLRTHNIPIIEEDSSSDFFDRVVITAVSTAEMVATMESSKPDILNARFVKKANGDVLIEVTGVSAENMDKTITVTINGLGTITFNGNAFAKAMALSSNTQQSNFGAALFNYGVAAKTCFGA